MLGKVIVRGDVVYLLDDPILEPEIIRGNVITLGETLHRTGMRKILVQGAAHADSVDDHALRPLIALLAENLPGDTRIAFAHAGYDNIRDLADRVCEMLAQYDIAAFNVASEAGALTWLNDMPEEKTGSGGL